MQARTGRTKKKKRTRKERDREGSERDGKKRRGRPKKEVDEGAQEALDIRRYLEKGKMAKF